MSRTVPDQSFLSFGEIIRQRISECELVALDRFRTAIRPIYGSSERGEPEPIGTCLFIEIAGKPCLVTAAHVIDHNDKTSLYVGGENLELIEAEFVTSRRPAGQRTEDHNDFAIAELPSILVVKLGAEVRFLKTDEISRAPGSTGGHAFLCAGYPIAQNRNVDVVAKSIAPALLRYTANAVDRPALAKKLGISGKHHLFIKHGKYSKDAKGRKVSSYQMRGCSGGAIIDLGNLSDPGVVSGVTTPTPQLAALLIEYHDEHQAIVGTRLDAIIKAYVNR